MCKSLEQKIRDRIAEIKTDERLTYENANVQINAPLALIQVAYKSAIHELENIIGEEPTQFPLPKKEES